MHDMPLEWWLRPVMMQDREGEHHQFAKSEADHHLPQILQPCVTPQPRVDARGGKHRDLSNRKDADRDGRDIDRCGIQIEVEANQVSQRPGKQRKQQIDADLKSAPPRQANAERVRQDWGTVSEYFGAAGHLVLSCGTKLTSRRIRTLGRCHCRVLQPAEAPQSGTELRGTTGDAASC